MNYDILHPTIIDEDGETVPFQWISLPDDEPAQLICMYDETGEPTEDQSKAFFVRALDVYIIEQQFYTSENTFNKPRFH